jgi:hypothetical protein
MVKIGGGRCLGLLYIHTIEMDRVLLQCTWLMSCTPLNSLVLYLVATYRCCFLKAVGALTMGHVNGIEGDFALQMTVGCVCPLSCNSVASQMRLAEGVALN